VFFLGFLAQAAAKPTAMIPTYMIDGVKQALTTDWTILPNQTQGDADVDFLVFQPRAPYYEYSSFTKTKVFQVPITGYDMINMTDIPTSWEMANVHQGGTPISEYVMAAILGWQTKIWQVSDAFKKCTWQSSPPGNDCQEVPDHEEVNGTTVGIVGYGHVGKAIATRAAAFGSRVIAVDINAHDGQAPPSPLAWFGNDDQLPRLAQEADFVVITLPLTAATLGSINAPVFVAMKNTSVLINIGRGPVVVEADLYDALKDKTIGGAVIDVWWNSHAWNKQGGVGPASWPAAHNFGAMDNVIMTPHYSSDTKKAHADALRQVAANMDHFVRGEPLDNVIRNGTFTKSVVV